MSKSMEKISHGSRFGSNLSLTGIVILALGILELFNKVYIAPILMVTVGFILAFGFAGIQIDFANKKIRSFEDFLLFKLGTWMDLNDFEKVAIKRDFGSRTSSGRIPHTFKFSSCEVYLTHENSKDLLLASYKEHNKARKFMLEYGKKLGLDTFDEIAIIQKASLQRRNKQNRR